MLVRDVMTEGIRFRGSRDFYRSGMVSGMLLSTARKCACCLLCAAGFADGGLGLVGSSKILLSFQLCTHTLHSPTRKPSLD